MEWGSMDCFVAPLLEMPESGDLAWLQFE